jgi:hypothetical protein
MNPLATPFDQTMLTAAPMSIWSPATTTVPSLPDTGCVGCPDWSGPAAPWGSTTLTGPATPTISALPTL